MEKNKSPTSPAILCNYEEAAEFTKDNKYILTGYRKHFDSFSKISRSLFLVHNESFNVWSHLLGVVTLLFVFLYSIFYFSTNKQQITTAISDSWNKFKNEIETVSLPLHHFSHDIKDFVEEKKETVSELVSHVNELANSMVDRLKVKLEEYKRIVAEAIQFLFN